MFIIHGTLLRLTRLPMYRTEGKPFHILRALWRLTLDPIYDRLFRRYFQLLSGGIAEIEAELRNQGAALRSHGAAMSDYGVELRTHIHGLNVRLDEFAVRIAELDERVGTVIAAHWEHEAVARRLAALEDRIEAD